MDHATERRELLRMADGREAPMLGLGTYQLEGRTCERAVTDAVEIGYRHIDTAEGYGNEESIARALAGIDREHLFLTSKVWRDHLRGPDLRRACEGSLRRLGTDYLDLYLIHWPNSAIPVEETVETLIALREEGRIRSWGVSNFTAAHLREAARVELPATNQVEIHPYFRQDQLTGICRDLRVPLTAYSPLARGLALEDEVIGEIAEERSASRAQVVLAWLMHRGHMVIPKATDRTHLEENHGAAFLGLSDVDLRRMEMRPQRGRLFDFEWSEFDR